jgi:hypothetical protein
MSSRKVKLPLPPSTPVHHQWRLACDAFEHHIHGLVKRFGIVGVP